MSVARTAIVLVLLSFSRPATAQVDSFDQLPLAVRLGDRVTLTDGSGRDVRGSVARLTPTLLTLDVRGGRRDFSIDEVAALRRSHHALAKGARWGLGIGATLGVFEGVALAGECRGCAGFIPAIAFYMGGFGSAIGVGVASLVTTEQTVYAKPSTTAGGVRVSPMVSRDRKGVAVSLGF